jgi:hypothetical protein
VSISFGTAGIHASGLQHGFLSEEHWTCPSTRRRLAGGFVQKYARRMGSRFGRLLSNGADTVHPRRQRLVFRQKNHRSAQQQVIMEGVPGVLIIYAVGKV